MMRRHLGLRRFPFALALATAAIAAGCGEKPEPDPGASPPDTQTTPGARAEFDIIGSWAGRLRQRGRKPFRVNATIASLDDSPDNRVTYTGIDCGGRWEYRGRNSKSYKFREVIDEGASRACKGTGVVRLSPTRDGRLEYLFRGGGVASRGILIRTGG